MSPTHHAEHAVLNQCSMLRNKAIKLVVFRHRLVNNLNEFSCAKPCACCTKLIRARGRFLNRRGNTLTIAYTDSTGDLTSFVEFCNLSKGLPSLGTRKRYLK